MTEWTPIRRANQVTSGRLNFILQSNAQSGLDTATHYVVIHSKELTKSQRKTIWDIFELNMKDLYTGSSFGWDPPEKRAELFHRYSRFLLAYEDGNGERMIAFSMFRFEREDDVDILYCYELQVLKELRRNGLGKALMSQLMILGRALTMDKISLTVFKANTPALQFYNTNGFTKDDSVEEDVDYEIFWKGLNEDG